MTGISVTQGATGKGRLWLVLAPVLLIFAIAVIRFAQAQNIWIDETTQLSGATLAPGPLLAWLTGTLKLPFGVPPDRMPPVSYFLDMIGWRIWGDNALAFRLFHAAITASGLAVLLTAVARRFNPRVALIAGLLLALSPKLVETAVEIRAYPVFFALSCAQLALVIGGGVAARPARLALFVLLGLLSAYTHFFGVVATSAFTLAVFIDAPSIRAAIRVIAAYALMLVLWAGLAPFIFGAASISSTSQVASTGLGDIAAFLLQLLASSPLLVDPLVAAAYLGSLGLLVLLGALGLGLTLARKRLDARHEPAIATAVALAAGIVVTLVAAFVIKGFDALAPRYNIWMMPPVALLVALAADGLLAPAGKPVHALRLGALALLAISACWAQINFLKRADWFVHGPSRTLEAMLAESVAPVAMVHVGTGWPWGFFPLYRVHRDDLAQFLLTPDGQGVIRITRGGDASGAPQPLSALAGYRTLLVGRIELKSYQDLRAIARGTASLTPPADVAPSLAAGGWRGNRAVYRPGNYAFTGQLYEKPATAPLPGALSVDEPE